jgi:hypothetical protein
MYKTVKFKKLVNAVRIKVEFLYREKLDTYERHKSIDSVFEM